MWEREWVNKTAVSAVSIREGEGGGGGVLGAVLAD